jgi:hypothetical protein
MLELSASTSHLSHVTIVTLKPCVANTSQLDDIQYEHVSTNADYEQCQNHYSSLSNTDHLQYDSLRVTTLSTTSRQYTDNVNNSDVTDDDGDQSVSTAAGGHNKQPIAIQRHTKSAEAAAVEYLTVLPDDSDGTALVRAQLNMQCK